MISIFMGETCLLKAKVDTPSEDGRRGFLELKSNVKIYDDLVLAVFLGENGYNALKDAREHWLHVNANGTHRQMRIIFVDDSENPGAFVVDELDGMFDVHDVSLKQLLSWPDTKN